MSSMVEELRQAFERAQQEPEAEQPHIARLVIEELEDQQWEESPELRRAFAEAHAEIAAGDVLDYEDYARKRRGQQR
jgi:hypothetical protein